MSWRSTLAWSTAGLRGLLAGSGPDAGERRMPITGHLAELRRRLILALFALVVGTLLTWGSLGPIYVGLVRPAGGAALIALSPGEGLATDIRLAVFGGCCLALPIWLVQAALFVAPALGRSSRRRLPLFVAGAVALAVAGGLAGYLLILPAALRFLLSRGAAVAGLAGPDGGAAAHGAMSVARYTGFALTNILAAAIAAETPVLLLGLAQLGLIRATTLRRRRREGWLLLIIAAAILTPSTDALTMVLLAAPLILLYELTLLLMKAVRA